MLAVAVENNSREGTIGVGKTYNTEHHHACSSWRRIGDHESVDDSDSEDA